MATKEDTKTRLTKLMEMRGLRQIDVLNLVQPYCKKYDVKMHRSDISQYFSGKSEPNQAKLYVLAKALNVSEAWLMGFDVPMQKGEEETQAEVLAALSKDEATMNRIMAYMSLSDKDKKMLDSIVDAYIANAKTEQP